MHHLFQQALELRLHLIHVLCEHTNGHLDLLLGRRGRHELLRQGGRQGGLGVQLCEGEGGVRSQLGPRALLVFPNHPAATDLGSRARRWLAAPRPVAAPR